jgi:hypothetical protein
LAKYADPFVAELANRTGPPNRRKIRRRDGQTKLPKDVPLDTTYLRDHAETRGFMLGRPVRASSQARASATRAAAKHIEFLLTTIPCNFIFISSFSSNRFRSFRYFSTASFT